MKSMIRPKAKPKSDRQLMALLERAKSERRKVVILPLPLVERECAGGWPWNTRIRLSDGYCAELDAYVVAHEPVTKTGRVREMLDQKIEELVIETYNLDAERRREMR
jgi:hypothetical protein